MNNLFASLAKEFIISLKYLQSKETFTNSKLRELHIKKVH